MNPPRLTLTDAALILGSAIVVTLIFRAVHPEAPAWARTMLTLILMWTLMAPRLWKP